MKKVSHVAFRATYGLWGAESTEIIERAFMFFSDELKLRRYLKLIRERHLERIRLETGNKRVTKKAERESRLKLKVKITPTQTQLKL